jgi:hypothetical protein
VHFVYLGVLTKDLEQEPHIIYSCSSLNRQAELLIRQMHDINMFLHCILTHMRKPFGYLVVQDRF